jgi:hypothetical protein
MSVENRYEGPLDEFALLVPVPTVLREEDVHTLDHSVFDAIEMQTGPQLFELDEQDPCAPPPDPNSDESGGAKPTGTGGNQQAPGGVTVNAEFVVGEYQVVVLSATESAGLQTWLDANGYLVPPVLGEQLKPYIANGWNFFVAKVDPTKVKMVNGHADLSPLRFDFDAPDLVLPIRLSAANSPGTQDILVHVAAKTAMKAANRENVPMPTGLKVAPDVSTLEDVYPALFDRVLEKHPGAVVTETAGASIGYLDAPPWFAVGLPQGAFDYVVTRLHLRVSKDGPLDDLRLEESPGESHGVGYQRYVPWTKAPTCAKPVWGNYEPNRGMTLDEGRMGHPSKKGSLDDMIAEDVPELGIKTTYVAPPHPAPAPPATKTRGGCCDGGGGAGSLALVALSGAALARRRARRAPGAPS